MNLAFEQRAVAFDDAVQRCSHPSDYRMTNPGLDILDDMAGRALVPEPIEGFGREPKLHE
jgi:hypothetical protein